MAEFLLGDPKFQEFLFGPSAVGSKNLLPLAGAMRKDLVEIVCCPVHKTPLKLTAKKSDDHGDILEGTLRCATCRFDYPIEEGIPNLLPPEYHVDQVKTSSKPTKAAKAAKPAKGKK